VIQLLGPGIPDHRNFWNGGCLNPDHGHPVPYTFEDHIRANVGLAARVHALGAVWGH
jgi:hypothetical protein